MKVEAGFVTREQAAQLLSSTSNEKAADVEVALKEPAKNSD
jgi:hypothetical protein